MRPASTSSKKGSTVSKISVGRSDRTRTAAGFLHIVSGGQTGVDLGALDAALAHGASCGGWCPAGRSNECGRIPESYPLTELPEAGYDARTRRNVVDSDGTAILHPGGALSGGTALTAAHCRRMQKPLLIIDASRVTATAAAAALIDFLRNQDITALNIAGPRASGWNNGYIYARHAVTELLRRREASR